MPGPVDLVAAELARRMAGAPTPSGLIKQQKYILNFEQAQQQQANSRRLQDALDETVRHNRAMEAQAATNAGQEKGWQLGTSKTAGGIVRVNPNMGAAQKQTPQGWQTIPIPQDYTPNSAYTAGIGENDNAAKLIADYKMAPLSGWAMSRPQGAALMGKVLEINPNYDAANWFSKERMSVDAAVGKTGTLTRSFNVFIQHTDVMREATAALGNGNIEQFNRLGQEVAQQLGQPAPTTFDAIKKIYGDELVKAIVGTGGNVVDRREASDAIKRARSPQQLLQIMDGYNKLIAGQVMGVRKQYESNTMRSDFDQRFLLPKTRAVLQHYGYSSEGGQQEGGPQLGQKGMSRSGKPMHFDGQHWVYD